MAKKIKFPLEMSNGEQVRTLDELKENFDIESVVGYFNDGRLLNWLQARYYDEEADKISALSKDDPQLQKKLCDIFGVESKGEEIDVEEIANRQERLNRLKQYTDDKEILERVDLVAFNQEDLGDLLDEEKPLIYLCHNKFIIPLRETHKTYIGIGKAVAVIRSKEIVDFEEKHIKFKDVVFDDDYENLIKQPVSNEKNVVTAKNIADNSTISNEPANISYVRRSKNQTGNNHFKHDFEEIEDKLSKPRKSNEGVKKALLQLEQKIVKQRDGKAMNQLATYYTKIHQYLDAERCIKMAKTFGYISKSKSKYQRFSMNIQREGNSYHYTTTIKNSDDVALLASLFVQTASEFESRIQVSANGRVADAKSILMFMSLKLTKGTPITIKAFGDDSYGAVKKLGELVDSGFREY